MKIIVLMFALLLSALPALAQDASGGGGDPGAGLCSTCDFNQAESALAQSDLSVSDVSIGKASDNVTYFGPSSESEYSSGILMSSGAFNDAVDQVSAPYIQAGTNIKNLATGNFEAYYAGIGCQEGQACIAMASPSGERPLPDEIRLTEVWTKGTGGEGIFWSPQISISNAEFKLTRTMPIELASELEGVGKEFRVSEPIVMGGRNFGGWGKKYGAPKGITWYSGDVSPSGFMERTSNHWGKLQNANWGLNLTRDELIGMGGKEEPGIGSMFWYFPDNFWTGRVAYRNMFVPKAKLP